MQTCQIVDFAVPVNYSVKWKESKKREKFVDVERRLKKTIEMKVRVIPPVIGALATVTKELVQGQEDLETGERVETIENTTYFRLGRILRRVLEN